MLELRPTCENCNKDLAPDSQEAMICTFECTFCKECVEDVLLNVCPNCCGDFSPRPIRTKDLLLKYPGTDQITYKPVNKQTFIPLRNKSKNVHPKDR